MAGILPQTIITAMVSPIALDNARTTEAKIPDNDFFITTFLVVCHLVAPSDIEASLRSCGTAEKISTKRLTIIGRTITHSTSEAVIREYPVTGIRIRIPQTP